MDPRTLAIGAVTTGGILFGAKMIGLKFPYKASCWFCSNRQTITFSERNSWMCEQCDQYNGFKKDGDYNKEIRGQKADAPVQMTKKYTSSHEFKKENSKLRLCDTCNRNQELKMHQLKQFEPKDEKNEDEELAEYTTHLERTYRLCRSCEARVRQVIGEQDSKLKPKILSWKLSLFRKSPLNSAQDLSPTDVQWSIMTMLALITLAVSIWLPSLLGTKFQFIPLNIKQKFEAICGESILPQFTFVDQITWSVPVALFVGYFQVPTANICNNIHHLIHIFCWLMVFLQRALDYFVFQSELASVCLFVTLWTCSVANKWISKDQVIQKKRNMRKRMEQIDDFEPQEEVEISTTPTPATTPAESPTPSQPFDLYLPNHEICQKSDEQCDISTLQIDGYHNDTLRSVSAFSLKEYNTSNQSVIDFGDISRTRRPQDSFLKPARFVYNEKNRVAQSSWVAGGYWGNSRQNPELNETLSRTSSQSSGFGSLTSAGALQQHQRDSFPSLPNSRLNSICGDAADRFSVFSEPAYKLNNHSLMNATLISNPEMIRRRTSIASSIQRPQSPMITPTPSHQLSMFRSQSVLGGDDDDSFNSSKFSQEAFGKLIPQAESSPKEKIECAAHKNDVSFLERKITIDISMYSLFLICSIGINVGLSVYVLYSYL